jgi:hypothetical protein
MAHCLGLVFGFSHCVEILIWVVLSYFGAFFNYHYPEVTSGEDVFKTMYAFMFGAYAAQ